MTSAKLRLLKPTKSSKRQELDRGLRALGSCAALLGVALTAHAAPINPVRGQETRYLSYDEAVAIALDQNADLLALRDQEDSYALRSRQALSPNNPVISYTKTDVPGFSLSEQAAEDIYSVSFTLGFPGKALSNSASIRNQAESAHEQASSKEIDIITSLSSNYVAFAINEAFYRFLLDEQRKDRELTQLLEKKFAASQAAKVDLLNARVVTAGIAQEILENRNDYEVLVTQFRQIIRRPRDTSLMPSIPQKILIPEVSQSLDSLTTIMLRNRHLLIAAEKQVDSSQSALTNAVLAPFPDFQLTAGVNQWHQPAAEPNPGISRDYTVGIGIAVPIFFPFNELPGMLAAKHDLSAAENQLESARLQALSDLETTYTSFKATLKDLDASEKLVVPAAKESYDLTLLTYGLGKADYFMLNQSRTAWYDAMKDMLTKRQNAAQLYNQLIAQVGCDISRTEGPHACH